MSAVSPDVVPAPESHRGVSLPLGALFAFQQVMAHLAGGPYPRSDGYSVVKMRMMFSLVWTERGQKSSSRQTFFEKVPPLIPTGEGVLVI